MRRLSPDPGEVDPVDAYGRLNRVGDRPRVRLNMIANITLSPILTSGDAGRILNGHPIEPPTRLELHHVLESESFLFLRYLRR
jgi:hypothetical protein